MPDSVGYFITALIYVALLSVLASPNTNAATAITTLTGALANVVSAATGGGSFSSTGVSSGTNSTPAPVTGGNVTVV